MAVRTRVEPISRDIELIFRDELSPEAQSAKLAQFAREQYIEAQVSNRAAFGSEPRSQTLVDGVLTDNIDKVRPNGSIVFEFDLFAELLSFIDLLLTQFSPVRSGAYKRSHVLFADGIEIDTKADLPDAREFIYLNTQPYARKIERGHSDQAPDGVYHVTAAMASRRFGNIARIEFNYRRLAGAAKGGRGDRSPAIIINFR